MRVAAQKESGRWLNMLPSRPATTIPNKAISRCLSQRLGDPPTMRLDHFRAPCLCGADVAKDWWHPIACPLVRKLSVNGRHNAVLYDLRDFITSSGLPIFVEPPHVDEKSSKRPDAAIVFEKGDLLIDVTIPSQICKSTRSITPSAVLQRAADAKSAKYCHLESEEECISFTPFVVSAQGAYHKEADKLIKKVAKIAAKKYDQSRSYREILNHIRDTLHSTIVKHNSRILTEWQRINAGKRSGKRRVRPQKAG